MPLCRLGPPTWSFAVDAHGCIMVPSHQGRPNTRLRAVIRAAQASSPPIVWQQSTVRAGPSGAIYEEPVLDPADAPETGRAPLCRPLWVTGLPPPDSGRSLRQAGYPRLPHRVSEHKPP